MTTRIQYFPLGGGLDVVTPALSIPAGRALSMVNFEPWYNGGYRRLQGYERMDGRPRPSDAVVLGMTLADATGLSEGDVLTGDTSGAIGTVIGISGNDVGLTKVTGTFVNGEGLNTAAYTVASDPVSGWAPTQATYETWRLAAEDEYRADIGEVPGSGEVRGAWQRGSYRYAVRNNAGGTAGVLHLASTSGWVTAGITMASYLFFDAGTASGPFAEGDAVAGLTSGATATVHRVILHAGAWDGSAEGYLVLTSIVGAFQNNEALQVGGVTLATANGSSSTFELPIDGHYQFFNHNFFGGSGTYRTYGCNGEGPGFEIDEDNIVSPILMPMTALAGQPAFNTPFLMEEHRNYLFMAFPGGSMQHSVVGEPLQFNGFLGAAEFGIGDEITGLNSVVGGVLAIHSEREVRGLFGNSTADWEMKLLAEQTGGRLYTAQKIDTVYSLDDLGVASLARSDAFGDFVGGTVSQLVQPLIASLRSGVNTSTIVRSSNQYRVYFNDSSFLIMYIPSVGAANQERQTATRMGVEFGYGSYPLEVKRIYNTEDETGKERTYFASDDGYVYEDQIGRNFDGAAITAYLRTAFNHIGSPAHRKRFRRADLELSATTELDLKFVADITYGSPEVSSGITEMTTIDVSEISIFGGGGYWDDANWDQFLWDGQAVSTARANLTGSGENIGFLIFNQTAKADPWIMQGIVLHYDLRRLQR